MGVHKAGSPAAVEILVRTVAPLDAASDAALSCADVPEPPEAAGGTGGNSAPDRPTTCDPAYAGCLTGFGWRLPFEG